MKQVILFGLIALMTFGVAAPAAQAKWYVNLGYVFDNDDYYDRGYYAQPYYNDYYDYYDPYVVQKKKKTYYKPRYNNYYSGGYGYYPSYNYGYGYDYHPYW